jgi:putative two-component system response regulator
MIKDLRNCKVLIVDDAKTNIDVLIQALGNEHKLAVAMNGKKALEHARNNSLDLILLDIMMPEMDGFEVCRKLKENAATRDIPIIFITAMDKSSKKTEGFEIGAVDYITKPFDVVEVKARVKTHLKLKLSQEALQKQNTILEEKVKERTSELADLQREILERLGLAAEHRDEETGQHIKRMSEYCRLLGNAAGLSEAENTILYEASTMHDVGKIGISDAILLKPAKLTREEFEAMKSHTVIGAKILSGSKSSFLQMAATIALTHHEKWDGTGYPNGLKGEDIPMVGRITCICDVFDALISERPYKKPWSIEKAMDEIGASGGSHFDPVLVEHFLSKETELREIIKILGLD